MEKPAQWVIFDAAAAVEAEDSSPSLNLVLAETSKPEKKEERSGSNSPHDFAFNAPAPNGLLLDSELSFMCAADEVFFKGQLLPLRPSDSRCFSRAESMDRCSSGVSSTRFTTSRSASSNSSSGGSSCISRSHSSSSCDAPRLSLSNNFYAHPSPTPQVPRVKKSAGMAAGRKSTGSMPPGWGVIRLGVVKAPEIELFDVRPRRSTTIPRKSSEVVAKQSSDPKEKKLVMRFVGLGMGCRCSPDAVVDGVGIKKGGGRRLKRGENPCRGRIFDWLEELTNKV